MTHFFQSHPYLSLFVICFGVSCFCTVLAGEIFGRK